MLTLIVKMEPGINAGSAVITGSTYNVARALAFFAPLRRASVNIAMKMGINSFVFIFSPFSSVLHRLYCC